MDTLNIEHQDRARYRIGNTVYRFRYAVISDGEGTEVTAILTNDRVLYHCTSIDEFVQLVNDADEGDDNARLQLHNLIHEAEPWQGKVLKGG
ncbi:hypothetical protein HRbin16_01695 [bacterium HR16]|nr:hypothetical protein HRbin16_01695 [bacterium HR16]